MKTVFGQALQAQTFEVIEPISRKKGLKQPYPHISHMERGTFGRPFSVEELIERETGTMVSLAGWSKNKQRGDALVRQSNELRDLLEDEDVQVYADAWPIKMTGAVTGIEYSQKQKRNINLLPDVAQRNRRQQQLLFFKFAGSKPYLRYMVLTAGQRITALTEDGIKARKAVMTRRISKWAAYVRKRFKINVYLASIECPRKEEDDGSFSYHLHANIIYDGPKLSSGEWEKFLNSTHNRLKWHLKDNGRLKDLNEAIKYVTKPEDYDGIEGQELKWLFEEWYRGRSFLTYGKFKAFIADAKARRLKVVELSDGKLVFMQKNTARRKTEEEKMCDLANKLGVDPYGFTMDELKAAANAREGQEDGEAPSNVVLTVTQPTTAFGPFREPLIIHFGINHNPKGRDSQARYADYLYYRFQALQAWEKNTSMTPDEARRIAEQLQAGGNVVPLALKRQEDKRAAGPSSYSVHNNTLTVHFSKSQGRSEVDRHTEDPPDPPSETSYLKIFHQN